VKRLPAAIFALGLLLSFAVRSNEAEEGPETRAQTDMLAVGFSQWDRVLEEQRGTITVVDLWASWCSPCIERFPHMVALYHKYRDRGVQFISLNFDEEGDRESLDWANQFLRRIGAEFPNYHMAENMTEAFARLDLLGLPVVVIYDAAGGEAYRLTGDDPNRQFSDQDVEDALLALLNFRASSRP